MPRQPDVGPTRSAEAKRFVAPDPTVVAYRDPPRHEYHAAALIIPHNNHLEYVCRGLNT